MTPNCETLRKRLSMLRNRAVGLEQVIERYDIAMAHNADRAIDDERYNRYFEKQSHEYDELKKTLQEIREVTEEMRKIGCGETPESAC